MSTLSSSGTQAVPRPTPGRRVTDAPTRTFHWLFALCFAGAYLTADGERLRLVHVVLGYTLAGLLVFRLLYGLFGPRQAGLGALWSKVANAPRWLRSLPAAATAGSPVNWRLGQNIAMGAAIVGLLLLVAPLTLSGYATYNDWGGEWLEDLHETLGEGLLWLVLAHLGLLLLLSLWRRQNQARPMWSGRVPGPGPDLVKHNRGWLAALLCVAVLTYWAWEWRQAPATALGASTPSAWVDGAHDGDD